MRSVPTVHSTGSGAGPALAPQAISSCHATSAAAVAGRYSRDSRIAPCRPDYGTVEALVESERANSPSSRRLEDAEWQPWSPDELASRARPAPVTLLA